MPATAGVGAGITPDFPSPAVVGETGLPASLTITNTSTGREFGPARLDNFELTPSCSSAADALCTAGQDTVYTLSSTGVGAPATGCAGRAFVITPLGPDRFRFTPADNVPIVLDTPGTLGATCTINFTVSVLKVPNVDVTPGGTVQTFQVAAAALSSLVTAATLPITSGVGLATVVPASPTLLTQASAPVTLGNPISDSAILANGFGPAPGPTGTIGFSVFGPDDPTCVRGAAFVSAPVNVAGNGTYASPLPSFVPTSAGTYQFVATYSGDLNNNPAATACGDPLEAVVVAKATPLLTTTASAPPAVLPGTITDVAHLAGTVPTPPAATSTGTIVFTLFGPADPTCAGVPMYTSAAVPVAGNGDYTSTPPAQITVGGAYKFIAAYSGDANNNPVTTACGDPGETVIARSTPAIVTTASAPVPVGGAISDGAVLSGATTVPPAGGTIIFTAFGPDDPTCARGAVFTSPVPVPVNGNGTYNSGPFTPAITPTTAGTYQFVATYSGDTFNNPLTTACGAPGESVLVTKLTPAIVTTASAPVPVGGAISDSAVLSGATTAPPAGGAIIFTVFGPDNANCAGTPVFTSPPVPVNGNGTYASPPFTPAIAPTTAGTYRFVAAYSGDTNNNALTTACGAPGESVLVTRASPAIVTTASASVPVGGAISDSAVLSGATTAPPAGGTIVFTVFGPDDPTCARGAVFTSPVPVPVNGNGTYNSGPFTPAITPTTAGTYQFVAAYSGDTNNSALTTACGAPGESVVITRTTPTLITNASTPVGPGQVAIHDTATLSNATTAPPAGGTIIFTLFGPDDATCARPPVFTSAPVAVNGNGNYDSPDFTPTAAGLYRWVATYSGDGNNIGLATACTDVNEDVTIAKATPVITTNATASAPLNGPINDSAILSQGSLPTGTIVFTLFDRLDVNCTGLPIFTSPAVPVAGNGTYTSAAISPSVAGTYRWIATYSGDAINNGAATLCNDPGEQSIVIQATPQLTTTASPTVGIGGAVHDTATLTGGTSPTGTIVFTLFGPDDATCARPPVFTSLPIAVNGPGNYQSGDFTPTLPGLYRFRATYSGDLNNLGAGPTACTDPAEQVLVTAVPTLTTTASATVPEGGTIHDTATLSGGITPTGTITFDLFGPDDTTCARPPIDTSTVNVAGNGSYPSPGFVTQINGPAGPGIYRYVARYSGDANNAPVGPTACGDPAEAVVVTNVAPAIQIVKTATPLTRTEPGGTFTFNLVITNPSPEPVTITQLVDDIYGSLATQGTCTTAIGTVLAPGGNYSCTFDGTFTGLAPDAQTDVATVTGIDNEGATVTANDNAVVSLTPVLPSITVVKTASPASLPEPGGTFTFSVVVTNTSIKPLTLTRLVDDVYGDLNGRGTCAVPQALAANGGTYSCTFPGLFNGVGGQNQTDTVTATGVDRTGNTVTAQDNAIVAITSVAPSITVVKSVTPSTMPEPGGTFTFTATVNNTSTEVLTLTSFVDSIYGDLNGRGTCTVPQTLAVGGHYTCTFPGDFTGLAPAAQTDTVTGTAVDTQGRQVTAADNATVTLTPVPPTIAVVKTAVPPSRPEPGGDFTFTVDVTNTSFKQVTITSLVDDVYGDLNGQGTCAIGAILAPGATYTCSFVGPFTGLAGDAQTDTVTVKAVDNRGVEVTASDNATVTLTPVAPTIEVIKTPNPSERPAPGGPFDFTVTVRNTTFEPLTLTVLTDDVYGNLNGQGNCVTGGTIAPGASFTCTFTGNFTGVAGDAQTDTVTATGVNSRGQQATATAQATVTLTPAPTIAVTKTPAPSSLPAPGGPFTFTVVVRNTTSEPLTVTRLVDDIYGDLNGKGSCAIGTRIAPGGSYTCSFVGNFTGNAGDAQTDTVTATAVNDRGQPATATAQATVTLTPAPSIVVTKVADPTERPAPGGTFNFTVGVRNTTSEPLTLTRLVDDVYGDLNGKGTCSVPQTLAVGATYTCTFPGTFNGNAGDAETDTVTATAVNPRGQQVTGTAQATVTLTPVPAIVVTKVADPTERPAPGGTFDFTVSVRNTTSEPLTLTTLVDDVYGDLNGQGTCSVPQTITVGATYTCTFPGTFNGNAGDAQTDTVTATAVNPRGEKVTEQAKATVTLTPVPLTPVSLPPVITPPSFVPPPLIQRPLARTGFGLAGPSRLAVAMILAGFLLILVTWRRRISWLPTEAVPAAMSSRMDRLRRSRADRSVRRLNSRLGQSRVAEPRWHAKGSRFSRGSHRSGRARRFPR
ncbi:MAG: hypothetical protein ACR2LJ_13100 [Acidimicrobiales bacterium]